MSGSRLGRGRGGRLAVYGGCGVVVILLVFLYRAATSEMARLRDLHIQCVHQHESLAAQLQVIFEYKVRLERSLAEEKSSNAAVKQELQQRATREKSLRDKDSIEAMQRFNSLQQTYKILQTEHQDLQDECKKREKQALEESNRLESTLQDLRGRLKSANEEKEKTLDEKDKTLENFKNKYLELETEKSKLEDRYNEMTKSNGNVYSTMEHLKKEVFQLKRELEEEKQRCKATSSEPSPMSQGLSQPLLSPDPPINSAQQQEEAQQAQPRQAQVSQPNNDDEMNPKPLYAPRKHYAIGDALSSGRNMQDDQDDPLPNEKQSDVRFAQENGKIIPVGPNEVKEDPQNYLPLPYEIRDRRAKKDDDVPRADEAAKGEELGDKTEKDGNVDTDGEDPRRQVLASPKKSTPKEVSEVVQEEKSPNVETLARPDANQNLIDLKEVDKELE